MSTNELISDNNNHHQVSYEVPFTADCGCLEVTYRNEKVEIGKLMPLYHSIYTKYWDMVVKPLNAVKNALRNGTSRQAKSVKNDINKIDQVKIRGERFILPLRNIISMCSTTTNIEQPFNHHAYLLVVIVILDR